MDVNRCFDHRVGSPRRLIPLTDSQRKTDVDGRPLPRSIGLEYAIRIQRTIGLL